MKTTLTLILVGFVVFCGALVVESGLFETGRQTTKLCTLLQQTTVNKSSDTANEPVLRKEQWEVAAPAGLTAAHAVAKTVILGAADPNTEDPKLGFKLQLQISSWGAAVKKATFSNGNDNGFDDRDYKNPRPLVILSPVDWCFVTG